MKKKQLRTKLELVKKRITSLTDTDQHTVVAGDAQTYSCLENSVNCIRSSGQPGSCANTNCISGQQTRMSCP